MHLFSTLLLLSIGSAILAGETPNYAPSKHTPTDYTCAFNRLLWVSGHHHGETCSGDYLTSLRSSGYHAEKDPWTRSPECRKKFNESISLCVFTDEKFAQGRGISLFTDESTAKMMSALPAFGKHAAAPARADPQPFVVQALPGRGMGVIANRTIERGDRIMAYTATTIINGGAIDGPSGHKNLGLLHKAVDQLPGHSRVTWLNLAAHFAEDDIYVEKINTNGFSEDFNDQEHYVVIPEIARMNHDCRPNAMYYFDSETLTQNVHAARTIYAGEEITITYIDPLQTYKKRRAATKLSWGFECTCSLCTQSTPLKRASDRRIQTIVQLTAALKAAPYGSQAGPEMGELLISLYDQERLYVSVADAYVLAARAYNAVGNKWTALRYAMKAVELGIIHSGPADVDVKDMWNMVREPREFA